MADIPASIEATLARLAEAGISLVPVAEISTHYVMTRDGLVALVERRADGSFGSSGNPAKMTNAGLAPFVRRHDGGYFVAKGLELKASESEIGEATRFARDLADALRDTQT